MALREGVSFFVCVFCYHVFQFVAGLRQIGQTHPAGLRAVNGQAGMPREKIGSKGGQGIRKKF